MEAWQQNEGKETITRNRKKSKESKHFIFSSIKHIHKTINTVLRKDNFEKILISRRLYKLCVPGKRLTKVF